MRNDAPERIRVTDENFGELLIEGLAEAIAIQRGEIEPARRVRRSGSGSDAERDESPTSDPT